MTPEFVGVPGLPRAGSTLRCQLLAQHPEIEFEIDPQKLQTGIQESDSHYHMKYLHTKSERIASVTQLQCRQPDDASDSTQFGGNDLAAARLPLR